MKEIETSETPHERRVTWALMAIVVGFVLVMTCIVVWVTASLIQNDWGRASGSAPGGGSLAAPTASTTPTGAPVASLTPTSANPGDQVASATPLMPAPSPTSTQKTPLQVDATWTPGPNTPYVRFVYWYVKPSRIQLGECVQITWQTEYAVKLKFFRDGEILLDDAPPSQTVQDCPNHTGYVVYRLKAWNAANESNWVQLQVKVDEAP